MIPDILIVISFSSATGDIRSTSYSSRHSSKRISIYSILFQPNQLQIIIVPTKGKIFFNITFSPDTVTVVKVPDLEKPRMVLLNAADLVVDVIPLSVFPRDRLNRLLEKRGFFKKTTSKPEAKEEL